MSGEPTLHEHQRAVCYMALDLTDALGILIAALGGAAVGLEREWSGHATGPGARFAGPLGGVRPRQLWVTVLFFSGLSFARYLTRRAVGSQRGYPIAGMLGGIISSTNVTLSFARTSRTETNAVLPLAFGVIGASAVMCVRVLVATAVLNLPVSIALMPYLVAPFVVAAVITWFGIRKGSAVASVEMASSNPLQFTSALQMAALFQIVMFGVRWAQSTWGQSGVIFSAGVLGLTDVDALVVSMTKDSGVQLSANVAARAIAVGVVANTLLKMAVGGLVGVKAFRMVVLLGLFAVALACAISLGWMR